jgi:hypothetical protein
MGLPVISARALTVSPTPTLRPPCLRGFVCRSCAPDTGTHDGWRCCDYFEKSWDPGSKSTPEHTAQLLSGSLMDYALPGADSLPLFQTEISEVPSTTNPLGMRGGSEGGITPGLAVVANAIVDALREFEIEHIELPATPERIWNAIQNSRGHKEPRPNWLLVAGVGR